MLLSGYERRRMIEKPLEQITEADLDLLVSQGRPEGRRLDYKLTLSGSSDKEVKEFLADVTSFANTDGGDLVIGVRDENGVAGGGAVEVAGIPAENLDAEILRIENQVRTCVDPRLPVFRAHAVPLIAGGAALILRMPASMLAPHRVAKGSSRFFARNSRGKFEMDTNELRLAFAATSEMPRKIRDLHAAALKATTGADMPCCIKDEPAVVLTVAPLSILREARDIGVTRETAVLPPTITGGGGIHMIVGLDGLVVHSPIEAESNAVRTWSVNHRRGYVDCAWAIGRTNERGSIIWKKYFEDELPGIVRSIVARLRSHGIEGPWVAMVTLRGTKGYRVIMGDDYFTDPAWQDPAYLGEVIDETLDPMTLQPFIEGFWRVFGIDKKSGTNGF